MTTYMLMSSRNLTYSMDYDGLTCLRCHITFGGYYYFTDVRPYFISVVTSTFVLLSHLPTSDIMVPHVFSPMNISAYNFLFAISFLCLYDGIELVHISNTLLD